MLRTGALGPFCYYAALSICRFLVAVSAVLATCPAGAYNLTNICFSCPPGAYCVTPDLLPAACPAVRPRAERRGCGSQGLWCCVTCLPFQGTYSSGAQAVCSPCSSGTYANSTGATACRCGGARRIALGGPDSLHPLSLPATSPCPAGSACPDPAAAPVPCVAGATSGLGATSCAGEGRVGRAV